MTYSTRDLTLAACLVTLGFEMQEIAFQYEGNRTRAVGYFLFNKNSALEDALKAYWGHDLAVEPITFATNIRSLKSQVHGEIKNPWSELSTVNEETKKDTKKNS